MSGPLSGVRVIELAGIGPGPFCGMVLSDHGAEVIRIERPTATQLPFPEPSRRGRRSLVADLKQAEGRQIVLQLVEGADALIEGFRPGVVERLGVGPDDCLARNPRLVYGRVTGWGQEGPLASAAGHDIDYVALSGVLHAIGTEDRPVPPLNLLGDYAGGGMLAAFGVVAALLEARMSGQGQVVEVAMVEGAALIAQPIFELLGMGWWSDRRGANWLDGGAPFYDVYRTSDGGLVAIGALEPTFYSELVERMGLADAGLPRQLDPEGWPEIRDTFRETFASRTRAEWAEVLEGTNACFAPVLSLDEAPRHHHNRAREVFVEVNGVTQPAPTPRFSNHARVIPSPAPRVGEHTDDILAELGYDRASISRLRSSGIIR